MIAGYLPALDVARAVLASHRVSVNRIRGERADGAQHFHFLVAQRIGFQRSRRLHRHEREQLHQVVLQHVAQGARLVVIIGTRLDAGLLADRDLHVVHEIAVPQRLDHQVRKTEYQQVLYALLGEVMVDAVDLLLVEMAVQQLIEPLRTFDVVAERLLHDNAMQAAWTIQSDRRQITDDGAEVVGFDGKIKSDVRAHTGLWFAQFFQQSPVRLDVLQVAAHVAEAGGKPGKTFLRELRPDL